MDGGYNTRSGSVALNSRSLCVENNESGDSLLSTGCSDVGKYILAEFVDHSLDVTSRIFSEQDTVN